MGDTPPVSQIARDMVVAFGLSRALRIVRLHHRMRPWTNALWGFGFGYTMMNMFPNWLPDQGVRGMLWCLNDGQVTSLYRILIGMFFMYQLDSTPALPLSGFTHPAHYWDD